MLPDVLASHSQNGSNDMGVGSASGVPCYSVADSEKSTAEWATYARQRRSVAVLLMIVATLAAGTSAAAAQAPAAAVPTPVGTMSELMVKIVYPASDAIFYI